MKNKLVVAMVILIAVVLSATAVLAQKPPQAEEQGQETERQEAGRQNGERLNRREMIRQIDPQCDRLKAQRGEISELRTEINQLTGQIRERIKAKTREERPSNLPEEEIRRCLQDIRQQRARLRDTVGQIAEMRPRIRAGLRAGNCDRVSGDLEDIVEVQRERIARLQQIRDRLREVLALLD
jgi:TolA-binding protein